nr:magnesium-dependent phosphatase 1 [Ipomoea batatas]
MGEYCKSEALRILTSFQHLPRLVIFDLDYTLWPFFCHMRCKCEVPRLYPQVKGILCALKEVGIGVGIASRSPTPNIANDFLCKLGIKSMIVAEVSKMGVTSILVANKGVDLRVLWQGLSVFSQPNRFAIKPHYVTPMPPHN